MEGQLRDHGIHTLDVVRIDKSKEFLVPHVTNPLIHDYLVPKLTFFFKSPDEPGLTMMSYTPLVIAKNRSLCSSTSTLQNNPEH